VTPMTMTVERATRWGVCRAATSVSRGKARPAELVRSRAPDDGGDGT
jgi:hypothetical protein